MDIKDCFINVSVYEIDVVLENVKTYNNIVDFIKKVLNNEPIRETRVERIIVEFKGNDKPASTLNPKLIKKFQKFDINKFNKKEYYKKE